MIVINNEIDLDLLEFYGIQNDVEILIYSSCENNIFNFSRLCGI